MDRKDFLKKSIGLTALISGAGWFTSKNSRAVNISNDPNDWPLRPSEVHMGKRALRDPQTGRRVWLMTAGHCNSYVPYQYNQAFSHDERYMVFNSDYSGINQLYRLEIATGDAAQLTYFSDYRPGPIVHPNGREVFVMAGGTKLWAIEIETGRTREVLDAIHLTNARRISGFQISGDGEKVLITYPRRDSNDMALALADANQRSMPEEVYVFEYHPIRGEVNHVGHPQFCPANNNLVSCIKLPDHQGGWPVKRESIDLPDELRARAWLIDLRTSESKPLVVTPAGHRATHEYWAPDGTKMYYHKKSVPDFVPTSIESVNLDRTEINTIIESDTIKLGHSNINHDGTKIISDSQERYINELLLIDVATGDYEILCWPNTTGDDNINHTHPNFSRHGNMVIFTSNATGYSQVYMIDLRDEA